MWILRIDNMRFIGNKEKLAPKIYAILQECGIIESNLMESHFRESTIGNVTDSTPKDTTKTLVLATNTQQTFCDCFAGSASMGRFFKQKGFRIISCDLLYFSYCLQRAYLQNTIPNFAGLQGFLESFEKTKNLKIKNTLLEIPKRPYNKVLAFLNSLQGKNGFIATHYAPSLSAKNGVERKYFSDSNAAKIDSIRIQIEEWKDAECITENEYYILLATLLESVSLFANVAGVYAAFCKKWDSRSVKPFSLTGLFLESSLYENLCFCGDSLQVLQNLESKSQTLDILYLDPPYFLTGDSKMFKGIYPMRNFPIHHNTFNHELLAQLLKNHKGRFILSYNDCKFVREAYKDFRILEPSWQYTMGQGETRIGKNRIERGDDSNVKASHELLIIKE